MAKSIDRQLAEAHAASARRCANDNPNHTRMQEIAKQAEQRARNTK